MATINPSQDYDFISTLTFASGSGTCKIKLYRGGFTEFSGTVYYRAGTSGSWTSLSVSGTSTTFSVSSTTMQVANDWNKSGNNYMTQSFKDQTTNLQKIEISQKSALSGNVGYSFMNSFAFNCSSLTLLSAPDFSSVTGAGDYVLYGYAYGCSNLTSLSIPDTSSFTGAGELPFYNYASGCSSLLRLELPKAGWFKTNNTDWAVPSSRLTYLKGYVKNGTDLTDWQGLTASGKTLYKNYIQSTSNVILEETANTTNFFNFM